MADLIKIGDMEEFETIAIVTTYKKSGKVLTREDVPEKPVPIVTTWDIDKELKAIAKIDGVIALWEAKRKKHQDVIDLYTETMEEIVI